MLIDLEKHKNKDGEYDIELYDTQGRIISDLEECKNEDGEFTIPVFDKNKRRVVDLQKYKNKEGEIDIDLPYILNGYPQELKIIF